MKLSLFTLPPLIIGSHDSASYFLNNSKIECGVNPIISDAIHLIETMGLPINNLVYDWSRTQHVNISTQLRIGARYLDLRVIKVKDEWYTCHGLLGKPLQSIIHEIGSADNPIIEITTFSDPDLTLCKILKGLNVYMDRNGWCPGTLDSKFIINTFANTPILNDMIEYNKRLVREIKVTSPYLFKMSWTLTPHVTTMIESLYKHPKTLIELANEANKEWPSFVNWMTSYNYTWPDIVVFDSF